MSQHTEYARDLVDAVGGPDNIAGVTHCATRLRFRLKNPAAADRQRVESLKETLGVMVAAGQLQVVIGMNVGDVYSDVVEVPGVPGLGEVDEDDVPPEVPSSQVTTADDGPVKKPSILDRLLATISAIFTPWIPLLASVGIIKGLLTLAVNFGWLADTSNTYIIMVAIPTALIYFFPVLLGFTAARQFGASPYVGALIGASLLEPGLTQVATNGAHLSLFGIPFTAQAFGNSVIPILLGMWAFGYLEKGLKRFLPKVTQFLLVPLLSVAIMVPAMMLVFGPVGFWIATGIANAYNWLVGYPIILGLIFGAFFIFIIMIGAHWVLLPIQLNILATQGHEYSLAAGGMGNYALLGVLLAVMIFSREKEIRETAGSAAFVNFLAGVTEPGLYGVAIKNKWYFVWTALGGAMGGLFCGITGTYVTAFAFTGLFGLPAFAASPTAVTYFIAVGITIVVSFVSTAIFERTRRRRSAAAEPDRAARPTVSGPGPAAPLPA